VLIRPLREESDVLKRKKKVEEAAEATRQFVGFRIGEELYGVDIGSIQEIDPKVSST
jgi:chemotaxis signal transduction protein